MSSPSVTGRQLDLPTLLLHDAALPSPRALPYNQLLPVAASVIAAERRAALAALLEGLAALVLQQRLGPSLAYWMRKLDQ